MHLEDTAQRFKDFREEQSFRLSPFTRRSLTPVDTADKRAGGQQGTGKVTGKAMLVFYVCAVFYVVFIARARRERERESRGRRNGQYAAILKSIQNYTVEYK